MKFIVSQSGNPIMFREGNNWNTSKFNDEAYGLFVDGNCVCFITPSQASFLNILKADEDKISNIEITDDKVFIQPKDAENGEYVRPTGDVQFDESASFTKEDCRKVENLIYKKVEQFIDKYSDIWDLYDDDLRDTSFLVDANFKAGFGATRKLDDGTMYVLFSPMIVALDDKDIDDVILHEMCHVVAYNECFNLDHGEEWQELVNKLNKLGHNITKRGEALVNKVA